MQTGKALLVTTDAAGRDRLRMGTGSHRERGSAYKANRHRSSRELGNGLAKRHCACRKGEAV